MGKAKLVELAKEQKTKFGMDKVVLFPDDFVNLINKSGEVIYLNKNKGEGWYNHRAKYEGFVFETDTKGKIHYEENA